MCKDMKILEKVQVKTVHDDDDEQARGTFAMNLYSNIFQIMIVLKSVQNSIQYNATKALTMRDEANYEC